MYLLDALRQLDNIYEDYLTEGTDYIKKAEKLLIDSGLYDESMAAGIIKALRTHDMHAFVHAKPWVSKYMVGVVRMLIEYAEADPNRADEFILNEIDILNQVIIWIKENRTEENAKTLDDNFVRVWSIEDIHKLHQQIVDERKVNSATELQGLSFDGSTNYTLVPINNFREFNSKYGGALTGDGSSSKYAGGGGTAWCHANNSSIYNEWIKAYSKKFFVLEREGFKDIEFDPAANKENPKDNYGTSLIALLVDVKTGDLEAATLRCNHVGVANDADRQYTTYAELSKLANFNVEQAVQDILSKEPETEADQAAKIEAELHARMLDMHYIDSKTFSKEEKEYFVHLNIPSNIEFIEASAFYNCPYLEEVVLPNTVLEIGAYAFASCEQLRKVTFGKHLLEIGSSAFAHCINLQDIVLPKNLESIGSDAFNYCKSLTSIIIPDSVTSIGIRAFLLCSDLQKVVLSKNLEGISNEAFRGCFDLEEIEIPKSVRYIGRSAFSKCIALEKIILSEGLTTIDERAFEECCPSTLYLPKSIQKISKDAFKINPTNSCNVFCKAASKPAGWDDSWLSVPDNVQVNITWDVE